MFKIICVTDAKSCKEDFVTRMEKIASAKPDRIIYRNKSENNGYYLDYAYKVFEISLNNNIPYTRYFPPFISSDIQTTVERLDEIPPIKSDYSRVIGVSVHSAEEAMQAESKGADYVIVGHIFETDCKKDIAPRGLDFLKEVCNSVKIPVYAIGGINPDNIRLVAQAGAGGACIMSGFMTCENPQEYMNSLRKAVADFEI